MFLAKSSIWYGGKSHDYVDGNPVVPLGSIVCLFVDNVEGNFGFSINGIFHGWAAQNNQLLKLLDLYLSVDLAFTQGIRVKIMKPKEPLHAVSQPQIKEAQKVVN